MTVAKRNSTVYIVTTVTQDLELKLARAKEDMDDIDRQFRLAKEDRETTAIQLHKMQEEFRAMLEDRDQSLKQWETTVSQADNCRKQLEKSRAVSFPSLKS